MRRVGTPHWHNVARIAAARGSRYTPAVTRDATALTALLEQISHALKQFDGQQLDSAEVAIENVLTELTAPLGADWQELDISPLLKQLRPPRRAQALARALWVASSIDKKRGRKARALRRCIRAMELYARLRMSIEEVDVRAARELAWMSAKLQPRSV